MKQPPRPARPTGALIALLSFVLGLGTVPHRVCERDAAAYFDGERARVDALAASVASWTSEALASSSFATGSRRFDGEWLFATYMMAATRAAPPAGLARGLEAVRTHAIQLESGLLAQAADASSGAPRDPGRGSGTALAAYFLAYADHAMSAALYRAVHRELFRTIIGFGAILEHPSACEKCAGRVDIDSGPVVAGFGVSATGFAIGASRANDDRDAFASLYATSHLFGAPFDEGATRTFATGGPLGDAILFAMLTAPRPAVLARSS